MKIVFATLAALALTAVTLYTFSNDSTPTSLLRADKGVLYDVGICGTNNYKLELVSFSSNKPVKSRTSVTMNLKFKSSESGVVKDLLLKVSKVIPLYSKTYKKDVPYVANEEANFSMLFSIPLIPIHATVDIQSTLHDADGNDVLTICAKLDI